MTDHGAGNGAPWPAPHPVIDAPYGPRFTPPAPLPVPEPRGRRAGWDLTPIEPTPRSTRWLVLFVAICLVVAAGGAVLAYQFVSSNTTPTEWDPKVRPIATFVETETGLTFVHAVRIRFLTSSDFNKQVTKDEGSLSASDRKQLADDEAIGRAFGWYTGTTDVLKERNTLNAAGILAYYDFGSRQIVARSDNPTATSLSVSLRTTIAHELVHALQDQRLRIRRLQTNAKGSEATAAATALIEGHAVYIEGKYLASLPASEQQAYFDEVNRVTSDIEQSTKDVARVISTGLEAPYVIGPALVAAAAASKGGIEQLFVRPPVALDQLVDPEAYFSGDSPETVTAPSVTGTKVSSGTVGIVRLFLTLASALPERDAWLAASTWGNDSYTASRVTKDGAVCVSWELVADTPAGASTLRAALLRWAASRVKQSDVTVEASTAPVRVRFCDPGTATAQTLVSQPAVDYFYARSNLLEALIENSGNLETARCATDRVMDSEQVAALKNPDDALRSRVAAAVTSCSSR